MQERAAQSKNTNQIKILLKFATLFLFLPEVRRTALLLLLVRDVHVLAIHDLGQLVDRLHLEQLFLLQLLAQRLDPILCGSIVVRAGVCMFVYNIGETTTMTYCVLENTCYARTPRARVQPPKRMRLTRVPLKSSLKED